MMAIGWFGWRSFRSVSRCVATSLPARFWAVTVVSLVVPVTLNVTALPKRPVGRS